MNDEHGSPVVRRRWNKDLRLFGRCRMACAASGVEPSQDPRRAPLAPAQNTSVDRLHQAFSPGERRGSKVGVRQPVWRPKHSCGVCFPVPQADHLGIVVLIVGNPLSSLMVRKFPLQTLCTIPFCTGAE